MEPSRVLKNMAVGWILAFQAFRHSWPTQLHTQKVGWLSPWFSLLLCIISPTAVTESFSLTPSLCHCPSAPFSAPVSVCLPFCVFLHSVGLPVSVCQFLSVYLSVSVFFLDVCCLFHCQFLFLLLFFAVYHFLSFFSSLTVDQLFLCLCLYSPLSNPPLSLSLSL